MLCFSEGIAILTKRINIYHFEFIACHEFSDEVVSYINVFCLLMKNGVLSKLDRALIVLEDIAFLDRRDIEFVQELL